VFLAVVGVGKIFFLRNRAPLYKSSARIWVQRSFFGGSRGSQPGEIPDSPLLESASNLNTFTEIVQSDAVLGMAYDELKEKLPASKVPPAASLRGIRAVPAKEASIITIDFRSPDPDVPDVVIKCVIDALMKENSMQIAGPLEETRERLNKQLEIARADYLESKKRMKEFKKDVGAVDFQAEAEGISGARQDMEAQQDEVVNELKALQTKVDFLQQQLGFGPDDVLAIEKISNDEVVNSLKQTIAKTEVQLIELKSKFQDDHPRVKRLRAVLDDAKLEMKSRYAVLIGKVDPKFDGISANNDVQHQLLSDMVGARTDMVAGISKLDSLKESLAQLNSRISLLPKEQERLADLQREDELATNTLAAVESELQRVKLTESVSLSSSRLQVIDSSQSVESSSPVELPVVLLVAALMAGAAAFLQFVFDPRVLSVAHLRLLSLRLVGWFPTLRGGPDQPAPYADRLRLAMKNWTAETKQIWITSPSDSDGRSVIAHALAESYADSGASVGLIDVNLMHSPTLHIAMQRSASPGLLQYLEGEAPLKQIVQLIRPNLRFVAAGGVTSNGRLLAGPEFGELVEALQDSCDVIILDGPAVGYDECSLYVSEVQTNLLVVVRMGHTLKQHLQTLKNQIQVLPWAEVGLVLNEIKKADIAKLGREAEMISDVPAEAAPEEKVEAAAAVW
jgi:uncharacterized protein involved in exopolysaccharide biosynthesis/MinD-like ATPase involved in chromosome partitioning or flagellar assembly